MNTSFSKPSSKTPRVVRLSGSRFERGDNSVPLIVNIMSSTRPKEEFNVSSLWMMFTWFSLPLVALILVFACSFSMSHFVILFSPSLIGSLLFYVWRWSTSVKGHASRDYVAMIIMTLSAAEIVCNGFFAVFAYFRSQSHHQDDATETSSDNEILVGALIMIALTHILVSLSVFTKFTLLVLT